MAASFLASDGKFDSPSDSSSKRQSSSNDDSRSANEAIELSSDDEAIDNRNPKEVEINPLNIAARIVEKKLNPSKSKLSPTQTGQKQCVASHVESKF